MIYRQQTSGMLSRVIRGAFFIVMASMVALSSCADDDIDRTRPITPPEPETPNADVLFEVNMPQTMIPSTYALGADDENNIKSIEILLFDHLTKGYIGRSYYCDKIEDDGGTNSSIKQFSVSLPKGGPYEIVILANSRSSVETNLAGVQYGSVKKDVLALLKMSHTGKWISNVHNGAYKPIPMWGEVPGAHEIKENLKFNASLMRMLAKIDVEISTDAAKTAFKLHSVHLVKANNIGYIVPDTVNLSGGVATAPTLPSNLTQSATITYVASAEGGGETALKNAIYTFEAAKTNGDIDATCIVLQGSYDGVANNFYRLDFGSKIGATTTYLDILRNHRYDIKVTKISGTGQPTLEDAIKNPSTNIITDLTVWDNAEFPIIVFDNTYSMGLSADDITVGYKASAENRLKVMTDYTGGWKIDKVTSDLAGNSAITWLTPTPTSGAVTSKADIKFNINENQSATLRICYIHISAGPLRHKIKVTQLPALRIGEVMWDHYDGKIDSDKNFTSISILDSDGVTQTHTPTLPPVGVIPQPLKIGGDIVRVTVTYKGYELELPLANYILNASGLLTITDYSLIGHEYHLDYIRYGLDGDYIQVSDVTISTLPNWTPIGKDPMFTGSYDGGSVNGHTGFKISGLNMDRGLGTGLFGYADGATFKNIHIASGSVKGQNQVGGICGRATNSTFSGCSNAATVIATDGASGTGGSAVGGICGSNTNSMISNCSNSGNITGKISAGGIAGEERGAGKISNCTNTGTIEGAYIDISQTIGNTGGIVGRTTGLVENCTNSAIVKGYEYVGGIVGQADGDGVRVVDCHNNTGSVTGQREYVGGIVGSNGQSDKIGGEISNCTNAATVTGTKYVGGIAGRSHGPDTKISGCKNFRGANVDGTGDYIGGIVGSNGKSSSPNTAGGGAISDCTNDATVSGTGTASSYIGGISGYNYMASSSVIRCDNLKGGNVSGVGAATAGIGGIVGSHSGIIDFCTNVATVKGDVSVGGIAGYAYGTGAGTPNEYDYKITNSKNLREGDITGKKQSVGGIVGSNIGNFIAECTNAGIITGEAHSIGGICGEGVNASIWESSNTGDVSSTGIAPSTGINYDKVGGIVGNYTGTGEIFTCANGGPVSGGRGSVGGIAGSSSGSIQDASNTAPVKGILRVGGIVGGNANSVLRCLNTGPVNGESMVGGITGHNNKGTTSACSNTGAVTGFELVGGVGGLNYDGEILSSMNSGPVYGMSNAGGVLGSNDQGELSACYNIGNSNAPVRPVLSTGTAPTNCYFGGNATGTPLEGSAMFSGQDKVNAEGWLAEGWPKETMDGWKLATNGGPWESLGGWSNDSTIYPSLANLPAIPTP